MGQGGSGRHTPVAAFVYRPGNLRAITALMGQPEMLMSPSHHQHDTLLDHPALAGHTVFVRRGGDWQHFIVRQAGGLVPLPPHPTPAGSLGWRASARS